jgi:formylmethanofuran dehydrogenase subunit A
VADVTVYHDLPDPEQMFSRPMLVFKDGEPVVEEGRVTRVVSGATQVVRPDYDPGIAGRIASRFERYHAMRLANFPLSDDEMAQGIGSAVRSHPCRPRGRA